MSNRWGIPNEIEELVRQRDTSCVYCGIKFSKIAYRKNKPSWEHINNDIKLNGIDNIALCCISCNASKGAKPLLEWLESDYCRNKGITFNSVADIVKDAILRMGKNEGHSE